MIDTTTYHIKMQWEDNVEYINSTLPVLITFLTKNGKFIQTYLKYEYFTNNVFETTIDNVKVNRFYPSSKTCHHCGYVKEDLSLKDRNWKCPRCGQMIDRDLNASINILNEGIRNISVGTTDYTEGADVRPTRRQSAMKSEAYKSLVRG